MTFLVGLLVLAFNACGQSGFLRVGYDAHLESEIREIPKENSSQGNHSSTLNGEDLRQEIPELSGEDLRQEIPELSGISRNNARYFSMDQFPYWSMAENLRTTKLMYDYYQDSRPLVLLVQVGEQMLERQSRFSGERDVLEGRTVPAWITGAYSCGQQYAHMVHSAILIDNVIFAIKELLRFYPAELDRHRMLDLAYRLEESINYFDSRFNSQRQAYFFHTSLAQLNDHCQIKDFSAQAGTILPLNMNAAAGMTHYRFFQLFELVGEAERRNHHRERYLALVDLVKSQLTPWNLEGKTGWTWEYRENARVEDSGHAFLTMRFMYTLYQEQQAFTQTEMIRLKNTFDFIYFDGDRVRSHLSTDYGKLEAHPVYQKAIARLSFLCSWDPQVLPKVEKLLDDGHKSLFVEASFKLYSKLCQKDTK